LTFALYTVYIQVAILEGVVDVEQSYNAPFLLPKGRQFINLERVYKMYVIIWNVHHTHGLLESYKLSAEGKTISIECSFTKNN
jgi:hypothetical protein